MLSKRTKYALKALIFLAKVEDKTPVQTGVIAEKENISYKFLESILTSLRKAGYLGAKKGKGGGYYLLKKPEEIFMAEAMRKFEGALALLPCASINFYEKCADCPDEEACSVHILMVEVRDSTLAVLANKTLKDLL